LRILSAYVKKYQQRLRSVVRYNKKNAPRKNELPEKTYLAKQMIYPIGLEVEKIYACSNNFILYHGDEFKDLRAPSVKLHGIRKGHPMRVPRPEEVP
jgi:hypothetical protein